MTLGDTAIAPRVNFITVLRAAFALTDPECAKRLTTCLSFFALSGFVHVKAACRSMMKLVKSGVDYTNMFMHIFYVRRSQKRKNSVKLSLSFCALGIFGHKSCAKMLMKLTLGEFFVQKSPD